MEPYFTKSNEEEMVKSNLSRVSFGATKREYLSDSSKR